MFSYLSLVSRLETLSNDIDILAYLILKLPIIFYIEQYVDHHNTVIDVSRKLLLAILSIIVGSICPREEN